MNRFLILLATASLLAACSTQGDGTPNQSTGLESVGGSASADASGAGTGGASAACDESFGALAELDVASISDLGDLQAEVQPTIEGCESVADWLAGAAQVIESEVDPDTAVFLLRMQCDDPSLADTAICEELASS